MVTLYHATSLKNLKKILKEGLNSDNGKPFELTTEEKSEYKKSHGIDYPGMPWHYTAFPRALYFTYSLTDARKFLIHSMKFKNYGKGVILKVDIPKTLFNELKCDNPKLLGSKNFNEWVELLNTHEPEVFAMARVKGMTDDEIIVKLKKQYNLEKVRPTLRGIILPKYIQVLK